MVVAAARERLVLAVFVLLAVVPFAIAASSRSFWAEEHSMAPAATAFYVAILVARVVGRYRWAWFLLALVYVSGVIGWAFDDQRLEPMRAFLGVIALATLVLLGSAPMRRHLRRPVIPRR
jgi:hypothetical protein